MDVNFRKIDIDLYDEDVLLDSELYEADPRDPAQALNDVKQKAAAVRGSLAKYVRARALKLLMTNVGCVSQGRHCRSSDPGARGCSIRPSSRRSEGASRVTPFDPGLSIELRADSQNLNLQTLVSILNSTKASEIPGVVKSLSTDAQDTLMKYLYKGMALPGWGDVSGSVLLGWHEKVSLFLTASTILRP